MKRRLVAVSCVLALTTPVIAILLLSLSPSPAMDVYHRWPPSLRWWTTLTQESRWYAALIMSIWIGAASSALGLMLALPAVLVERLARSRHSTWVLLIARAPVCMPPIVLAVGFYQLLSRIGLFDTAAGLILAHTAFTTATAVFILLARFQAEPLTLYHVARSLGSSPTRAALTWLLATQRLTLIGCFAAGTLISMSEVTVTLYTTDTKVLTLSRLILSGITREMNPTGFAAMAAWMFVLTACAIPLLRDATPKRRDA